ncbi:MAG: RDD family protein [Frankiales bacterium]|nr:RDD family protein [Frankiales bacterium]
MARQTTGVSVDSPYGDPLVTGEAVALELRTAGVGSRGIAAAIDLLIQGVLLLLAIWLVAAVDNGADLAALLTGLLVAVVVVVLGFPVGFETLARGRTPGKAIMGLRVLRDDGGPIRFRHAFVRGLVGVVVERPGVFQFVPALVCMLVNQRSKRLGDLAAGTIVVQERVPAKTAPPPLMPAPLAGWAEALDLSRVDDALALEIRHFLGRSAQLAPWAREQIGQRLTGELLTRTAPPPAGTPPWAYLSAVLAERRRRELSRLAPPPATTPLTAPATAPLPVPPSAEPPQQSPGPFAPPG